MKISVEKLLSLNHWIKPFYMCDPELENLLKFNRCTEYHVDIESFEEIDGRWLTDSNMPLEEYHYNISHSKDGKTTLTFDNWVDMYFSKMPDASIADTAYSVYVNFYNNKPIMIRLLSTDMQTIAVYYMNIDEVNKFRHDLVYYECNLNDPLAIGDYIDINGNDDISLVTDRYETIVINKSILDNPIYTFYSDSELDDIGKIIFGEWLNYRPVIHPNLQDRLIGCGTGLDIDLLPLSATPRISLSLYTDYANHPSYTSGYMTLEECVEDCTSIWSLNLDGKPIILYIVHEDVYVGPYNIWVLDIDGVTTVRSMIHEITIPDFEPIPEELIVDPSFEIDLNSSKYIDHQIIDNTLHCILDDEFVSKYFK